MALINAKCTNCNATLKVDDTKDAMVCEYCGSAFIVEKAINNYNIINNNEIHANVVNIYNQNKDFEIKAGTLIKYNGKDIDVIVPDNVIVIGEEAFDGLKNLRSIKFPDGLKEIGDCAFWGCENLDNIELPASVEKIGYDAFAYTKFLSNCNKKRKKGICWNCGSQLTGIFNKKCTSCGTVQF